jgi:hypothetical protein
VRPEPYWYKVGREKGYISAHFKDCIYPASIDAYKAIKSRMGF